MPFRSRARRSALGVEVVAVRPGEAQDLEVVLLPLVAERLVRLEELGITSSCTGGFEVEKGA
jgi:hypothetical protein